MSSPPKPPPDLASSLEELRDPAILLSTDYRVLATNQRYVERYGQVPELGRSRCHEVSHGYDTPCDENGESCPLAACRASGQASRVSHVHHTPRGPEHCDITLRPIRDGQGRITAYVEIIQPIDVAHAETRRGQLLGRSRAFSASVGMLRRAAPSEVPVLLLGESGTGKELMARALHHSSERRHGAFVPLECSGLPEALFESELFGYEKGAFTGADRRTGGLVDAAAGGTLFLDEIGDVPLSLQVKLLRLLESGTYRRVGGKEVLRADFRLVCATHRDLLEMVSDGSFRRDLYYRINTFPIPLPPLRDRLEDLPLLCRAFLAGTDKVLSDEALTVLQSWDFPGNIRELKNLMQRAALLADGARILPRHLPMAACVNPPTSQPAWMPSEILPLEQVVDRYLRWAAGQGLERRELASALGMSERTLYRRLRALREAGK